MARWYYYLITGMWASWSAASCFCFRGLNRGETSVRRPAQALRGSDSDSERRTCDLPPHPVTEGGNWATPPRALVSTYEGERPS